MTPRLLKQIVLEELSHQGPLWDHEIAQVAMEESGKYGRDWFGTMRTTLADLLSGGLIQQTDIAIDPALSFGEEQLLGKYTLTDFGLMRLRQAGFAETKEPNYD